MSQLSFDQLTLEETRNLYPSYSRRDITCFSILQENAPEPPICVGIYGLIERGLNKKTGGRIGEGFLTIFPDFRFQTLNKTFLKSLFDHAFTIGFQKVYTWTRLQSWQHVLNRFERWGIRQLDAPPPWDSDPTKIWFAKEKIPKRTPEDWYFDQEKEKEEQKPKPKKPKRPKKG